MDSYISRRARSEGIDRKGVNIRGIDLELKVNGLTAMLSNRTVLDNVTFSVPESKCLGVCGPNGSGKTTLLLTIAGLYESHGTVTVDGKDVAEVDPCEAGIHYVADTAAAFDMTVSENLEMFYQCYRGYPGRHRMDSDIEDILEAVKLVGRKDSMPGTLSDGMRKGLSYARTMVGLPDLVIMDEPFSCLDTEGRIHLEGYVRALKSLGTSFVISSNDLMSLQRVSDTLLFLKKGKVLDIIDNREGLDLTERYLALMRGARF